MAQFLFKSEPIAFAPKVDIALVYCICEEKFLFLRRDAHSSDGGRWTVPSGKIEKGETPLQGVLRELKEETGLSIEPQKMSFLGSYCGRREALDLRIYMFYTILFPSAITLNQGEHDQFAWIAERDVLSYPLMHGADECFLEMRSLCLQR